MRRETEGAPAWFEELVRPSREAWIDLCHELERLFSECKAAIVYGLPEPLIDAIVKEKPNFFNDEELRFERRLAEILHRHFSVGLAHGKLVRSSLFEDRRAMTVSPEDINALGWEKYGLTSEKANQLSEELESRASLFHEQLVAYAGWLVTNATFLREAEGLRKREQEFLALDSDEEREPFMREMNIFLNKWELAKMVTWDLPEPQGPNLAGVELPQVAQRNADAVVLQLPLTTRLPARFPIRDVIAEIRNQIAQPHLLEWHKILDQQSKSSPGLQRFSYILHVHFFRNIVLASRYGDRFKGKVASLDRAFGAFLGVGEDSAKKVRLEIDRRLSQ